MLNKQCIFKSLTTTSHSQPIAAVLGLMCVLSIANWSSSIAATVPEGDPGALNAQASWEGVIQLGVQFVAPESITSETAWIDEQVLRNTALAEPEPIIVGTALLALYEKGLESAGPFAEPEPIIVGTALIALYEKGPGNLGPFAEPDPIIVGDVLMTLSGGALGEVRGVALFAPADEQGGEVVVGGKQYGIRFLWRLGSFWVGRDSLTIVVSD